MWFWKSYNVIIYNSIGTYLLSTCLGKNLTLWTRTVTVWPEIAFLFIVEKNHFARRPYFRNAYFIYLYISFFKFLYARKIIISSYPTKSCIHLYYPKWFLLSQIKINNSLLKVRPQTLWTVDTHAKVNTNWASFMVGDADLSFTEISVSHFLIGSQEFFFF